MQIMVDNKYIWFPVQTGAGREKVNIYLLPDPMAKAVTDPEAVFAYPDAAAVGFSVETPASPAEKLFEFDLPVVTGCLDFYAALCVEAYLGRIIEISVDFPAEGIGSLVFRDQEPPDNPGIRPLIHFTSGFGWINDPNGLFFRDGNYHMYYQHNPYDTKWGNMHWGHAVSNDLIHWKQQEPVLFPDEYGTVFSGSAIQDRDNNTGHGWNTILYYYTAAGGTNLWSGRRKYTQRLAFSTDGGRTLHKDPCFELGTFDRENRDPKVFYHMKTHAYIMVLFFDGNEFGIFRSTELDKWELTQRLTLKGGWECPDLVELPVEGSDQTCWIFWTADGFYYSGTFDGFRFIPSGERKNAYIGAVPYAAQTFSGVTDRVISMAWLRISPPGKYYAGIMSVPSVLSLVDTESGPKVRLSMPEELISRRVQRSHMKFAEQGRYTVSFVPDQAYEICLSVGGRARGTLYIDYCGHTLTVDFEMGRILADSQEIFFDCCGLLDIDILVDYDVIELRAQNDTLYYVFENVQASLSGPIEVQLECDTEGTISIFDIK